MKKYSDIKKEFTFPDPILPIWKYFAYKDGKVIGEFDSEKEAKQFANIVEKVLINKAEAKQHAEQVSNINSQIYDIWYTALREEYSDLSDDQFNICYDMAYDRGHSCGHDEVANYMIDVHEWAVKLIQTVKS